MDSPDVVEQHCPVLRPQRAASFVDLLGLLEHGQGSNKTPQAKTHLSGMHKRATIRLAARPLGARHLAQACLHYLVRLLCRASIPVDVIHARIKL